MTNSLKIFDVDGHLREALGEYALGCLPTEAGRRVEAHLDYCGRCRHELDDLFLAITAVGLLDEAEVRRIIDEVEPLPAIASVTGRRRPVVSYLRIAAAAAVLAFLGGLVGGLAQRDGSSEPMVAMAAAQADDALTGVSLAVNASARGDRISLSATVDGLRPDTGYTAFVVSHDGVAHPVRHWSSADGSATFVQEVAIPIGTLAYFSVVADDGRVVLLAWFRS